MSLFKFFKIAEAIVIGIILFVLGMAGMRSNPYAAGTAYDAGFLVGVLIGCFAFGIGVELVITLIRFIGSRFAK